MTWTLENAPSPPYDWARRRLVLNRGWYTYIYCSDADEMIFDGLAPCCDVGVYGPFQTREVADEAGMDITKDTGPWYHALVEVA